MIIRCFNKTISILITVIFLFGLFPPMVFAGPSSHYPAEIMGINKTMFDNSFSKADREINPERWLSEAKLGITQVINSWEHIVFGLYEDPSLLSEAKISLEKWSNEELESRFSDWLIKRFFGDATEKILLEFSQGLSDTQKKYSWHLDNEGNVIFDDKTGDPLVIRPDEENREFSEDIIKWKNEVNNKINTFNTSYNNIITQLFPEILTYIPPELREKVTKQILESTSEKNNVIKRDFENIAAREERIFTSRRTRDIWSLRNKNENESAKLFTERLLAETDTQCRSGIEELNIKIEQAEAGVGDLALLGEEWLRLYKNQFEKGLKAWEDAEERFFIRRIEWEQDSFKLFSEGEEIWLAAFNQFEEERQKWELNAKNLLQAGENLFTNLSEDFEKNINEAKKEFELNMTMRINEGTTKIKSLIDMYLTYASTAVRTKETIIFWQKETFNILIDPDNIDFISLLTNEMNKLWLEACAKYNNDLIAKTEIQEVIISNMSLEEQIEYALQKNYQYIPKFNVEAIKEIQSLYYLYLSYLEKAVEIRDIIKINYAELLGTGALKDVLASEVSSEDFYLDEYQIALLRAKALVLYWEKKTEISQAILDYADDLSANRITEAEGIKEWEKAKDAYNKSLADYEIELNKLNKAGTDVQKQQEVLIFLSQKLQEEENKLNHLYDEYRSIISVSVYKNDNYYLSNLNTNYQNLLNNYKVFEKTGSESEYKNILYNGVILGILEALENPDINWQDSLVSLITLFNSYGFICDTYFLPDVHDIVELIINKPGDFTKNTAQFLIDFDNCFTSIPYWLETEIENWKEALIEYVTVYAFYNELKPQFNSDQINDQQNILYEKNQELFNYLKNLETNEIESELINNLIVYRNESSSLSYMNTLIFIWENINKASLENNNHWRQSISEMYINNIDSLITFASTWEEGILSDSFFIANYYSNRLNDSFILFSQMDTFEITEDISFYSNQYYNYYYDIENKFNTLLSSHELLINSIDSYKFSLLSFDENKILFENKENAYKLQENVYNKIREQYLKEAENFNIIGSLYDEQYHLLKKAQAYNDSKRFEYEKQDAIQRWASTSYIGSNFSEYNDNKIKLQKAQIVLEVLDNLYKNENIRTINNDKYNLLYSDYEQSFNQKIKTLEIANNLFSIIINEKKNNAIIYTDYQNALNNLGSVDQYYTNYVIPEDLSLWTGKDIIMVKNGKLAFSRDESMSLTGLDELKINDLITFFNSNEAYGIEQIKISEYEKALRGLNERMMSYLTDKEKFKTWGLARDYLINSLIQSNEDISYLKDVFSGYAELIKSSTLGSQYVMESFNEKDKLYYAVKNDSIYKNRDFRFSEAWEKLSEEEKADLEFYIIITLTNSNGYSKGFSEVYTQQLFKHTYDYVKEYYNKAEEKTDDWWEAANKFIWGEMKDVNKSTLNRIKPLYKRYTNNVNNWINNLQSNQLSIIYYETKYLASCQNIFEMEFTNSGNSNVKWDDIYYSLETANININDINDLKLYWEAMQKELKEKQITDIEYKGVTDALYLLCEWTAKKEKESKTALNNYLNQFIDTQLANEENFLLAVDKYISGIINLDILKSSAQAAYGKDSISMKSHYINMQLDLINDISIFMETDFNFTNEFNVLSEELITITKETLKNRYHAELCVREAEWEQMKNDIFGKNSEWQNSAALILENGRMDWISSSKKMEDAYKQWYVNFQNEYERVNNEWNEVYLAGLEDKEKWLIQASNAADQASSEALLLLIGTEGERLSRFTDTREPFGIRNSLPQAQYLMSELLQSSGITNMTSAFNSLISHAGITSPLIKHGMGGISTWDAASTKIAASDLAKKSNSLIADNEAKVLAYNVSRSISEAINRLTKNVENANKSFRENMDDIFVFKGLWRKTGKNYKKDVVKGSTLFNPVISETVTVNGYVNYIMEPVKLKINLDEYNLINLSSIAINSLVENAYSEVEEITKEIFGSGKESPGKFGTYIGNAPETKPKMGKKRKDMFSNEGSGELGRLMVEFTYWNVIDTLGMSEVAQAPWDKRIWNDEGSCFTAPSLRTAGQIAGAVAATVVSVVTTPFTAGASAGVAVGMIALVAGISTTNDMIFNSLDAAYGYKTWGEAMFETNKSFAINFTSGMVTAGIGGYGKIAEDGTRAIKGMTTTVLESTKTTASTIATQTIMAGVQSITSGISTSLLSGFTYSSENGFGYSEEIASAGLKNIFTNSLVSMATTFTTSSLTGLNSGFEHLDNYKLTGFNNLNQSDLQKLNNLAGSLAGQGVNYALGNDFTLNLLNFSLLSGNSNFNTGLLELHLGNNGTTMNFGTGGANVSIDNMAAVFRGAQVWDVNNRITRYTDKNNFKEKVTLRAQYGYGDSVQKDQLFDILDGDVKIRTDENGDFFAETTNEDSKRVINLTGYQQGMSTEEQFRLAVILGHEAYRDGYIVGQTDASGNIVTNESQSNEFRNASIARLAMGTRINAEHDWFYDYNGDFDLENSYLLNAKETGDYSLYDSFLEFAYKNDEDYFFLSTKTGGSYQNESGYSGIPLFGALTEDKVKEMNDEKKLTAFENYLSNIKDGEEVVSWDDFYENKALLEKNGYVKTDFISLYNYGCKFMSTKYMLEAVTGKTFSAIDLHNYAKENNNYTSMSLLSDQDMANIINNNSNGMFSATVVNLPGKPDIEQLYKLEQSQSMYLACLDVGGHFVALSGITFTFDDNGKPTGISNVSVSNPWNSNGNLGKSNYSYSEIQRWAIINVTPTSSGSIYPSLYWLESRKNAMNK